MWTSSFVEPLGSAVDERVCWENLQDEPQNPCVQGKGNDRENWQVVASNKRNRENLV